MLQAKRGNLDGDVLYISYEFVSVLKFEYNHEPIEEYDKVLDKKTFILIIEQSWRM